MNHPIRANIVPLAAIAASLAIAAGFPAHAGTRTIANKSGGSPPGLLEALPEPFPEIEVAGAGATLTRDPAGGFRLSAINGRDAVKISGKASRMVVDDINGEAVVDLAGNINGSQGIISDGNAFDRAEGAALHGFEEFSSQ
jgi:hypothetical protein